MTVAVQVLPITYNGNGTASPLSVPFRFLANDHLIVTRVADNGARTVLVRGTDYSVSGAGAGSGGTVTPLAAIAVGVAWEINRATPREQPTAYPTGDDFPAATHELALDRQALIAQEIDAQAAGIAARTPLALPGQTAPAFEVTGLLDDDLLIMKDGRLQRFDQTAFAGKFYAGGVGGRFVPSSGTGVGDENLRADVAAPGGALILGTQTGQSVQGAIDGVATRTTLKALTAVVGRRVYLAEDGREGDFIFRPGDLSQQVADDTQEGVYMQADGVAATSGAWVRVRGIHDRINLRWFGAKGDGTTLDDDAIEAWVKFGARGRILALTDGFRGGHCLYAPKGTYIWTRSAIFSPNIPTFGMNYEGDGRFSTVFVHDPSRSTGEVWAFKNSGNATSQAATTFRGMAFFGDGDRTDTDNIGDRIHFWDILSDSFEQSYRFYDFFVKGFNNVFTWRGNNVNSEVFYFGCDFSFNKGVLWSFENPQAYNHDAFGCSIIHAGTVVRSRTQPDNGANIGAPAMRFHGGNLIMLGNPDNSDSYFYDIQPNSVGVNIVPMVVNGARFELRETDTKLFRNSVGDVGDVNFNDCNFLIAADIANMAIIRQGTIIRFTRCTLDPLFGNTFSFLLDNAVGYGEQRAGELYFHECRMPQLGTLMNITVATYGRAVATGCTSLNFNSTAGIGAPMYAVDFALGEAQIANPLRYPRTYELQAPTNRALPGSGSATAEEYTFELALGEVIEEIHFEKPATTTGDTISMAWSIGTDNKSDVYAITNTAPFDDRHFVHVRDLAIKVNSDNRRKLRVWASDATTGRTTADSIRIVTRG